MTLTLTETAQPSLVRLPPKAWLDKVRAYAELTLTKKRLASEARAADEAHKSARAELLRAMSGAPAAACGNYVLSAKASSAAEASVTTIDGKKIKWSAVTSLLVGNETVPVAQVMTIYGGRSGSIDLDVAGG